MKRTTLEEYVTIIKTISEHGPIDFTQIKSSTNIDVSKLAKALDFLTIQKIIEKNHSNQPVSYIASKIAIAIVRYFYKL